MSRPIFKIEYVTTRESDLDEYKIYAFGDSKDIHVLCRFNDKFFWKCFSETNLVWYKMYDSIEDAVEGVIETKEFKKDGYTEIQEFETINSFLEWANKLVNNPTPSHAV